MREANQSLVTDFILLGFSNLHEFQIILFMIFLVVYLITLIESSLLVLVSTVDPALQTPMYFFLRNLSLMDIGYTTVIIPKMLTNFLSKDKSISFGGCAAQMYFAFFFGLSECWILTTMAYDRQAAICDPLCYSLIMNQRFCLQLALASWLTGIPVATIQTTMMFTLPFCGPNVISHFVCYSPPLLDLVCTDIFALEVYSITGSVIILILPFGVIIVSYVRILVTILKMSSAEGHCKAFSTCLSHLIMVSLFFGAVGSTYFQVKASYSPEIKKVLSLSYSVFTPMLNPLIYSLRNQEVKSALKRILGRRISSQDLRVFLGLSTAHSPASPKGQSPPVCTRHSMDQSILSLDSSCLWSICIEHHFTSFNACNQGSTPAASPLVLEIFVRIQIPNLFFF
ncbi:olfactory receptor 10A7-like [Tachyglossus aculeatus]|uniref:olfactory receptor 10A7-like n=1 Tax=Tachyglossus aculeatus TaxID=9261 RepID=UPI0018F32FC7|nr:olfactory receptor 10A7-like [Tachyglossus aculeatus]